MHEQCSLNIEHLTHMYVNIAAWLLARVERE